MSPGLEIVLIRVSGILRTRKFFADQTGAITVDWVVLCAALVSLAIVVLIAVSSSTTELSNKLSSHMSSATVATY